MSTQNLQLAAAGFAIESGTPDLGDGVWSFGGASVIAASIPVPFGARITGYTINHDRGGSGTITVTLCKKTDSSKTAVETTNITTGTGWAATPVTFMTPHPLEAGYQLYLRVECSSTHLLGAIFVDYETDGVVNVKHYGAVGDGTNDDASAISSAIAAASSSGETIFFPPGTYKLCSSLSSVPGDLQIVGDNATIKFNSSSFEALRFANEASKIVISGLAFEGNTLDDDYTTNVYAALFFPIDNVDITLSRCTFSWCPPCQFGGNAGVHVGRMLVDNCRFLDCTSVLNVPGNSKVVDSWFANESVLLTRSHAIYIFGEAENIMVSRCHFKNIDGDAIKVNVQTSRYEHKRHFVISDNHFEGVASYCIWLGSDQQAIVGSITVEGNSFRNCSTLLHSHNCSDLVVSGNIGTWDWEVVDRGATAAFEIAAAHGIDKTSPAFGPLIANNRLRLLHPFVGKLEITGLPSDGNMVTVGSQTYTWRTSASAANEVNIGSETRFAAENLMNAIRGNGGFSTMNLILRESDDCFFEGTTTNGTVVICSDATFTMSRTGSAVTVVPTVDKQTAVGLAMQLSECHQPTVTGNTFDCMGGLAVLNCVEPSIRDNTLVNTVINGVANAFSTYRDNKLTLRRSRISNYSQEQWRTFRKVQCTDAFPVIVGNGLTNDQLFTNPRMLGGSGVQPVGDGKAHVHLYYGEDQGGSDSSRMPFGWSDGDEVQIDSDTGPGLATYTFRRTSPGMNEFNTKTGLKSLIDGYGGGGIFTTSWAPFYDGGFGLTDPQLMIVITRSAGGTAGNNAYMKVNTRSLTCGQVLRLLDVSPPEHTFPYLRGGVNGGSGTPIVGITKTFCWTPLANPAFLPRVQGVDSASQSLAPVVYQADIVRGVGFYITHSASSTGSEKFAWMIEAP